MTDTPTETRVDFAGSFTGWLTGQLSRPAVRSALRNGDHEATEQKAYPYLARWWGNKDYLREPLLLVSAVIARTGVKNTPGVSLGRLASKLTRTVSSDGMDTRILVAYGQSLDRAHAQLSSILRLAATQGEGVDYEQIVKLYLGWDGPYRKEVRRRFLEDYYGSTLAENNDQQNNNVTKEL